MTELERLERAYESAVDAYERDKEARTDSVSLSYDAGRVDGLKEAVQILRGAK